MRPLGSKLAIAAAFVLASAGGSAQTPSGADPLDRLELLIGRWAGTSEGQPGKGTVRREYSRVLRARFIRAVNRSEYPPQEKNPAGEVHEDEGFFGYDRTRKRLVLRQFHVEGFVNTYVEDGPGSQDTIVFTTEAIENFPAGWRARESYVLRAPDELEEVFELAGPGKPFELYSRTRLERIK
jgi:hypothetical protein